MSEAPSRRLRSSAEAEPSLTPAGLSRRQVMAGLTGVPLAGGLALAALKTHGRRSPEGEQPAKHVDALSGATISRLDASYDPRDIKGRLPKGKIKDLTLSRVILGGT